MWPKCDLSHRRVSRRRSLDTVRQDSEKDAGPNHAAKTRARIGKNESRWDERRRPRSLPFTVGINSSRARNSCHAARFVK